MGDRVSIVVPVYNVQKYLDKCVQSIISQTYTDLEIILVDDGSPDECGRMCDEYADKDDRIKVIHKANGGLSDARNSGIANASGKYITFVDSDDFIHHRYIEILTDIAAEKQADLIVGDFELFQNAEQCKDKVISDKEILQAQTLTSKCLYDNDFIKRETMRLTVAWGKLYERRLWEGIEYPVGKIHEDTFTTYKLMEKASKVVYLKEPLYYWRENPDSITRGHFTLDHLDGIAAYREQIEYFHRLGKQRYVEIVFDSYLEMFFWCYNRMREAKMDLRGLIPYWRYMKEHIGYIKISSNTNIKKWMRYRYLVWYKIPRILK